MKKIFFWMNVVISCAVYVGNYFYLTEGGLLLKGLCSSGFALMGIINLIYALTAKKKGIAFHAVMSAGLILAMLGDIYLGFNFILGAGLFALGHICYYIAQCTFMKFKWLDIIISGVLFAGAGSFVMFCPLLTFDSPVMQYVCAVYALIISLMVGKAVSDFIRKPSAMAAILMIGSVLFFFSDLMLVLDWFMGLASWTGKLCMATYYPAQCFLAFSSFYYSESEKK